MTIAFLCRLSSNRARVDLSASVRDSDLLMLVNPAYIVGLVGSILHFDGQTNCNKI